MLWWKIVFVLCSFLSFVFRNRLVLFRFSFFLFRNRTRVQNPLYITTYVHEFIEIKSSHTVKMALDYECYGSVPYNLVRCTVLSKTNWLKNITLSSVILSDISVKAILIPAVFPSVEYRNEDTAVLKHWNRFVFLKMLPRILYINGFHL